MSDSKRLAHAFMSALWGMATGTPDGQFEVVNDKLADMLGYSREELEGQSAAMVMPPDIQQRFPQRVEEVNDKGVLTYEAQMQRKDGSILPVRVTACALRDNGEVSGRVVAIVDISMELAQRARLRESETKYEMLFSKDPSAVLLLDLNDMAILDANPAALQLYGYSLEEILELQAPELSGEPEATTKALRGLDNGQTGHIHHRVHRKKDGTRFSVEIVGSNFAIGERRLNCSIVRDIDEQLRQKAELKESRDSFERLFRYLQKNVESERSRDALEINEELAPVLTALSFGLQPLEEDAARGLPASEVAKLSEYVRRAITSVKQISTRLRPGVLDHLGLVPALEWLCEDFSGSGGMEVVFDCPQDHIKVSKEHATAAFRVCQEALTNAVRHSQGTIARVELHVENHEFILQVMDDGNGGALEASLRHISMGLSGMRERARAHRGSLEIERADGGGSTVRLRMPCAGKKGGRDKVTQSIGG